MIKKLLLLLVLVFSGYQVAQSQCTGCTMTVNASSSAAYSLLSTDVLCITGGTYTGAIAAFPNGAKICVSGGASFNPSSFPASSAGVIIISPNCSALLPAITTGSGFKIDNYGVVTFNSTFTLSGVSTINNYEGSNMTISQAFTLATVGSSITNKGSLKFSSSLAANNSTNFYNYGTITVATTFTNGSSFKNYGKLTAIGNVTFNSGSGSLFHNYCTLITDGNVTNSNTNAAGLNNYGFIIADAATRNITNSAGCTWFQTADGVTKGINYSNAGTVTGKGNYYFTGTTTNTNSFGADAGGINFHDTGLPAGKMDTPGTIHASVTTNSFTPPTRTDLVSGCNISVNKGPIAADDYYITSQNNDVFGNVFANDIDPENNILTLGATLIASPSHASAFALSANGDFTYTPAAGYYGADVFIYSVCDNGTPTKCDTASVVFTVNQNPVPMPSCDNPGNDPSITLGTVPNTYYPGTASANAGATTISLGARLTGDAGSAIAVGDKLMIIQIQGGDINTSNNDSYGDGVLGGQGNGILYNTNISAGTYEFATAASAVPITGGTLTIESPLVNSYVNGNYVAGSNGQRRFQVIKVPQYSNLRLTADITVPAWNGTAGGIFCISVANTLDMAGFKIDAKGKGFRGGAGRTLSGNGGVDNDFRTISAVGPSGANAINGAKGEGIAGTPRYLNNGGALLDTGVEGYPLGSQGQGAPGNAGGGGTDGTSNSGNDQNTGGGGGGNGGSGGKGGNAWSSAEPSGGEPGASFLATSASKLVLGGGAGAGSTNNGTGTPASGFASSGAAGGGMVIIYADRVSNTGTIDVSGADANNTVGNDASGGGGAGGSALLVSNNSLTGVKVLALGGNGGTNTGGGAPHGPGGGGGGGVILSTSSVNYASRVTGGLCGNTTTTSPIAYGATIGYNGKIKATVKKSELPAGFLGCFNFVVAANDNVITSVDTPVSGNVTSNDFDGEGNAVAFAGIFDSQANTYVINGSLSVAGILISGASAPNAGTISLSTTGAYTFTPATGFVGSVDLLYKVTDNYSYQAIAYAKLKIHVSPGCDDENNVSPMNDHVVTYMNVPVTLNVLTNDIDAQGDKLLFNGFINPSNSQNYLINGSINIGGKDRFGDDYTYAGQFSYGKDGSYTFTPVSYFVGSININYEVCDDNADQVCKKANLKISVEPTRTVGQNSYPYAGDNAAFTYMDTPLSGASLLRNAGDANVGDVVSINTTPVTAPTHGSVTINSNGTYVYTPNAGYTGSDYFIYSVCDNATTQACSQGVAYIQVIKASAKVTQQPVDRNVCVGENTVFSTVATGTNLTYQWQVSQNSGASWSDVANGGIYAGATSASLSLGGVTAGMNNYLYRCALPTDCGTVYTNEVTLALGNLDATIINQPENRSICSSGSASFAVNATGSSLAYQWQVSVNNGVSFSNISDGAVYSGTTNNMLLLSSVPLVYNNNRYRCVVTSSCAASATSASAVLEVGVIAASVVNNPVSATYCEGTSAGFSVYATGSALTYQWQENQGSGWNNLSESSSYTQVTNDTLIIANAATSLSGYQYRCVVASGCASSATTSPATLTITAAPVITKTTQGTQCGGGEESLLATASAGTINWYDSFQGGSPIATGGLFVTPNISSNTNYYVDATSAGCRSPFRVNVLAAVSGEVPTIISQPVDGTVCEGTYHQFSIIAGANATSYQWQVSTNGGSSYTSIIDNSIYSGARTADLMIMGALRGFTNYRYRCVVQSNCSPDAISNAAVLTVNYPPEIVVAPVRSWVCAGSNALFSVSATGGITGYQWQVSTDAGVNWANVSNGGVYSNATTATLNITGATVGMHNYLYRCVVTGSCLPATTSSSAPLVTNTNTITVNLQPASTAACVNTPMSLTVIGSGPILSYQWQFSSDNGTNWNNVTNGGIYSNATTSVLNISDVTLITTPTVANNYRYRCVLSSSCVGASTTTSVATVSRNTLVPTITVQPAASTVICEGTNASLTSTATVTAGTPVYQWQYSINAGANWNNVLNSGVYSGANETPLGITSAVSSMNGTLYRTRIYSTSNTICPVNTSNAALTVNPLPAAPTSAFVDRNDFCADDAGNISLSVTGGSGVTVEWFTGSCGGVSAGTGNPLVIASPTVSTTYYARWSNSCGVSSCVSIDVTVRLLPVTPTSVQTDANNFCESDGGNINLSSTGGSGTLMKWFTGSCGGTLIGSGSPLTIASPSATTTYYAYYENGCGVSLCSNVTVTVNPSPVAPTASASQTFCGSATIASLSATAPGGSVVRWYATASGGAPLAGTFALTNGSSYYAESYNGISSCMSDARTAVEAIITSTPPAPTGDADQTLCSTTSPTLNDLVVVGNNIQWYTLGAGGSLLPGSTPIVDGTTYHASQTWNGCESTSRFAITAHLNGCNPLVTLSSDKASIAEVTNETVTYTATLSYVSLLDVTVNFGFTGTATVGSDYSTLVYSVVIPAGQTTATFDLSAIDDNFYEGASSESIVCSILSVVNGSESGVQSVSVSVVDNESSPMISIADATAVEGDDLTFTVTLNNASAQTISVDYATSNGSATAGLDYTAKSGTLIFNSGTTTQTITVNSIEDILFEGSEGFSVTLSSVTNATVFDGTGAGAITNDDSMPVAAADSYTVLEGGTLTVNAVSGVLSNDTDADGNALAAILVTNVSYGTLSLSADGSFTYAQNGGDSSSDSFTYKVNDGANDGNTVTVTISITAVNDEPSFSKGANQTVNEDAAAQTVAAWATAINKGAANESSQTLIFTVTNDNNGLFSVQPAINATTGNLTYTPAANANGSSTVSVVLTDNGGTANGGDDTYATQSFTITVNAVNDEPSFAKGANQTVNEDVAAQTVAAWATSINKGAANESGQTLTFTVTNNNNSLFSVQPVINAVTGNLTYTPAPNANGSATVSVVLTDNGGTANGGDDTYVTQTFSITVTSVNDVPVAVADSYTVAEGGTLTVAAFGLLSNDTDADGNTLTSIKVTNPTNGNVTVNTDGSFTYIHNGSETTSDSFTYKVNDGTVDGNTVTVSITVTAVNDTPVAVADSYTVAEGGTLTVAAFGLLSNDTDAEGNTLTSIKVTNPTNGTVTVNANGSFTYIHNGGETTSDSFTYKVNDGTVDGNTVTVSITVTAVNDAPVAVADSYTVAEGGTLTVVASGLLLNDSDAEGNTLTSIKVTNPTNGTVTVNTNGSFTYIHNGSETTSDSFTYKVNDGTVDGNTVIVSITVTAVNDAPVAVADSYTVAEGGTLTVAASGLLSNDTDADGNTLTSIKVTNPTNGTVTVNANGSFTYIHNGGETTSDSFTYKVNDGTVDGNTVAVSITVTAVNDAPVAVADSYTMAEGGTLTIAASGLLSNDSDADGNTLTSIKVTNPANGTVTVNANGSFAYIHNGSETTSDSFTYKVNDGTIDGNTVTVSITVTAVNDAPVAVVDSYTVAEGGTLTVVASGLLSNDTDAEGNTLTAIKVTNPANGTVTVNANGSFTYIHNGGETTSDSFTYKVNDGTIDGNTVTVSITVTAVNDAPVAVADSYTVAEGSTLTVAASGLLSNDTDAEGNTLTAIKVTDPSHGTLTLNANGSFTYVHDGSETLSDSFSYKVNDGSVDGNTVTVTLTITPVNDAPVAVADSYSLNEGDALTITVPGLLSNDTDADGNTLTVIKVTNPLHGSVTVHADGSFTYTHDGSETTSDSFTYKVNDGTIDGNTVTVSLSVSPVNDAPVAVADSYNVNEGGVLNVSASGVLSNDTDADGNPITAIGVSNPLHGTLVLNADGSFTYTHDGSETTSDSFTYKVNDGSVDGNTVMVSLTINPVNDNPVAIADNYNVAMGATININAASGLLINDTDAENNSLTAVLVTNPTHGTLTLNANGSFTYTHDNSVTYTDAFTYRANDGNANSNIVTVTLNITGVNNMPVSNNDGYSLNEGATITQSAANGVLKNDTDGDNDPLTAILVSDVLHGTLTLHADGSFTYTHDGSETTSDSFTYRTNDGKQNGNLATVTFTVNGVNDAPVTVADSYSVNEGATLTVAASGVLTNDTDIEGDALTAVLVSGPANGSLSLNADGSFTYTHNGGETTSDSFTYHAFDGTANGNTVTVSITVLPVNDAPVALADSYTLAEGGVLTIDIASGLLANDNDVDGDALNAIKVTNPAHGTLVLNNDGSFTYTHNGGETTSDSFTYKVNDSKVDGNTVTVSLAITPENDAPAAVADSYNVNEGGTLTETAANGVLKNDVDADGNPLSAILVSGTTNGTLTLHADGSYTYTHNGGETTSDSFTYKVNDGLVDGITVTVSLSVTAMNDAPVAVADAYSVAEGGALTVNAPTGLLNNDTDAEGNALTAIVDANPSNGTLTLNIDGSFTYIHDGSETTFDSFTYHANDGTIDGNVVTVTINVTAVNDAPFALADSYNTTEGGTLTVAKITGVLKNDTDAENNELTSIEVTVPTNGSLTLNTDGSFTYIHNGGETTSDSFTYKVNDGSVDGNTVTVTIAITPVNDAPMAVADSYSVAEGATLTINAASGLLTNDTDADGDALTSVLVTNPVNGTLTLNADGSFTYIHNGSETTSDSFTYKVNDGSVDGNTVTVSLTISPVNDAPVAVADEYDVAVGGTLTINNVLGVLKNDTDAENDALTAVLVSGPSHGTLTFNADGSFTYTHDNSVTYTDTYTYRTDDGQLQSSAITVTINITGVNNKPVAVAESYSVNEGGTLSVNVPGLLSNDTDADGDAITAVLVSDVSHGSLTLNADGSFTYINDGGEAASDMFSYRAFDGKQNGNIVDVVITINGINDAPVAVADAYTVAEGNAITIDAPGLLGNDSDAENDALTTIVVANPTNGTLTFNTDGSFTYTHNGTETNSDSFSYKVTDGNLESNVVAVSITVTPVNDLPLVNTNTYTVAEGGSLSIDAPGVLGNDTDAEGDALTAILVDNPLHGTLTFNADGSFTYTHDGSETTSDSFTYLVDDGKGNSLPVIVTINVNAVNDAPVAANDNYSITEGGTLTITIPGVLGNDSDAENNVLTTVLVAAPVNGTLTLNADGSFTYIHNGSETLSDSFTYKVNDGTVDGNTATVAISITPVNDTPVGVADTYDVAMGATITIGASVGVLNNDTDAENDALTAVLVTGPSHGTLTLNADGSFLYNHDNAAVYTDVFTYKVIDGVDQSAAVTVTLNITGVNNKPVAVADSYNVSEGATLTVPASGVLVNDTDVDADALTTVLVTDVANGLLTFNADGSFTYVHNGGETSSDSFDYQIFDGKQNGNTVTVTIQVDAVNDAPVAVADSYLVDEGATLVVGSPGVMDNDTDAENSVLTVVLVDSPSNGTITLNADGSFTYVHNGTETLTDSFSYKLSDGTSESIVVVTLGINPVNDAPLATNANSSAKTNTTLTGTLAGNVTDADGDVLTFDTTPVSGPANGVFTLNADGTYTYVPYTDFVGTDVVVVQVCDAFSACTTLILTIEVVTANTAPVVTNSAITVVEDGQVAGNIMLQVSDPDGDALTINTVPVTAPQHGILIINADGTYTYTPTANYFGTDSFVFEVCDNYGGCTQGMVTITVTSVNDAPVVVSSSQVVLEDEAVNGNLLVNATDADGDALSVNTIPVVLPLHGTLIINTNGTYVYTPTTDYVGDDSFVYEVCDVNGACSQATVTITVNAVNDAPVIGAINQTVMEDESVTGKLLATVTDAEGDALVVNTTPIVVPQHGTLVINPNGTFTYTPDADFNGSDSFVFEVCDDKGACAQSVVDITVMGVNDVPVAVNDNLSVGTDQSVVVDVLFNDTNLGDGDIVVSVTAQPKHGQVVVNNDATLTYTPSTGFKGVEFISYRVCDANGDCAQAEVTINATGEALIIPHGFSPNGDGVNDFFVIPDLGKFNKVSVEILNRWGNTVYKKDKYLNDWDGLANIGFSIGKELPAGTYFYVITVDDIDKAYSGYVYLNR